MLRLLVLGIVTVLHELSHWKLRRTELRPSPKKFKFKPSSEAESGHWVEKQLFGGTIRPKNLKAGAEASILCMEKTTTNISLIDDNFGYAILSSFWNGNQIKFADVLSYLNKCMFSPKTKAHTTEELFRFCKLGHDRSFPPKPKDDDDNINEPTKRKPLVIS